MHHPARIDILWVVTIECQYWQDSARIWQEMTNYAKTQLSIDLQLVCSSGSKKYALIRS